MFVYVGGCLPGTERCSILIQFLYWLKQKYVAIVQFWSIKHQYIGCFWHGVVESCLRTHKKVYMPHLSIIGEMQWPPFSNIVRILQTFALNTVKSRRTSRTVL